MKKNFLMIASIILVFILFFSGCTTEQNDSNETSKNGESNGSIEEEFTVFDYPPVNLDKVAYILPMGLMTGGHVTPIDHQYYVSYDFNEGDAIAVDIDVYSPGDGVVTSIQHMSVAAGDSPMPVDDFRLVIQHTDTLSSIFIHIDELSEKLLAYDPGHGMYANVDAEVSAGEIIGKYGGSVDYNIVDENVILNFSNPDSYVREDWKIHCADPFDYFNDSIKKVMVEKCLRSSSPIGGKIDYDTDGRLVGTWFEENTNGYAGVNESRYWAGHLSIVYDAIDPDAVIVSIGTFINTAEQFAVKGNSPDPANASVEGGLVVYELVDCEYHKNNTSWDRNSLVKGLKVRNFNFIQGVILLQLIEEGRLKVEIFPNKTAEEVDGFTDNALFYVR